MNGSSRGQSSFASGSTHRGSRRWGGALLAVVSLLAGCAEEAGVRSIVWISVDTLRADHLEAYGYPRPTSPFLESLAREGVVFERAFAATSSTAPSHATMLTGLHPGQHGLRRNGQRLPDDAELLTERLAEDGWDTAGFVSTSAHFSVSGLAEGFAHFDEPSGGATKAERPAHATVAEAIRWLEARRSGRPLFLWIHLFDPHSPYRPRQPLREPANRRKVLLSYLLAHHHVPLDFFAGDEDLLIELIEAYDGEILAVDEALRSLHHGFAERVGLRDAVWIVTSDHGEGLGNHDWLLHGKMIYNEQLRVPLIVHAPGRFAPARVPGIAQHVDLLPTVLEMVGLDAPAGLPGRSLLDVLRGRSEPGERHALSQRRSFAPRQDDRPPPKLPPRPSLQDLVHAGIHDNYEPGEAFALQNQRYKLLFDTERGAELYDVAADPYETEDLAERLPDVTREMREQLERTLESLREATLTDPVTPVDPETQRALEALGYVDS